MQLRGNKMAYAIEYKIAVSPYHYEYDSRKFKTLVDARKRCISLIERRSAILCVIRNGVEQLVYATVRGGYVLEDRTNDKWYHLNRSGTLGTQIRKTKIKDIGIIQSASQRW